MRKIKTEEEKKAAYEKQKAAFRAWYAQPENRAKKMEANQAWKDAHRQHTRVYSRNKYYERRKVTLVKEYRSDESITVWFINRAEMNAWLRANDLHAYKSHFVKSVDLEVATGIWVKADKEYYVTLYTTIKEKSCLHFSN